MKPFRKQIRSSNGVAVFAYGFNTNAPVYTVETHVPGGHGGSHGHLGHEFVMSILENRQPLVDVAWALNVTVPGVVAHQSALKDGELLKIPRYEL